MGTDVGAHIGTFSKQALADGAKMVVAVEASPITAESLKRNLAAEAAKGRAIVIPTAAWSKKSTLKFYVSSTMSDSVEPQHDAKQIEVEADTLDSMVASAGIDRIDLIKMDIEGAEVDALKGAATIIQRFRPRLIIVTEHRPEDLEAIPATVMELYTYAKSSYGPCILQPMRNRIGPEYILFQ